MEGGRDVGELTGLEGARYMGELTGMHCSTIWLYVSSEQQSSV